MDQTSIKLGRCTITYEGNFSKCLSWLKDNWNDEKVIYIFQSARRSYDAESHFRIDENDHRGEYILKHVGDDNFRLSWKYF